MSLPSFVRAFSHSPFEWQQAMREWCKTMRSTSPIWYDEQLNGWRLFRYEDIVHVQRDYKTFSSEPLNKETVLRSIISLDPPYHRQLRSLVTPAFSPRALAQQASRIQQIARELLTKALEQGEMDLVADFAVPFPVLVIADLLGLPRDNWQRVKEWTDLLMTPFSLESPELPQQSEDQTTPSLPFEEIYMTMRQAIEDHRQHPREDLLSLLLAAEIDGEHLTEFELLGFFLTLLVAGNLTTTQLLGNAMLCFDAHPTSWRQLEQDRSLITSAVEEILRYLPPNRGTGGNRTIIGGRVATADVKLGEQMIRKGEEIYVTTLSANFDEHHFHDPDRFDIRRTPNHHLSFGHGIHFCLGAPLARLEVKIALELLLEMMPNWHLRHDVPLQQIKSHIVFGVQKLPISFSR